MNSEPHFELEPTTLPRESLSTLVARITTAIDKRLGAGDVAALRRMQSHDPSCIPFWKIVAGDLAPSLPPTGARRDEMERRWAVLLSAMAELRGLHRPRCPLGRALAQADFSEHRVLRLLRAHGEVLGDSVRTVAHYLGSKAAGADLRDLAWLVLSDGRSDEEKARRQIARDYFRWAPNA